MRGGFLRLCVPYCRRAASRRRHAMSRNSASTTRRMTRFAASPVSLMPALVRQDRSVPVQRFVVRTPLATDARRQPPWSAAPLLVAELPRAASRLSSSPEATDPTAAFFSASYSSGVSVTMNTTRVRSNGVADVAVVTTSKRDSLAREAVRPSGERACVGARFCPMGRAHLSAGQARRSGSQTNSSATAVHV
jgi:hypothetical protein